MAFSIKPNTVELEVAEPSGTSTQSYQTQVNKEIQEFTTRLESDVQTMQGTIANNQSLLSKYSAEIQAYTNDIQSEMIEGIDEVAEHIRSINCMTPLHVGDLVSSRIRPVDMSDVFDQERIILDLSNTHDDLAGYFEDLAKMSSIIGDELTQDLAADRGRVHKKNQWHLRASMDYS